MIKYCEGVHDKSSDPGPSRSGLGMPQMSELKPNEPSSSSQPGRTPAMSISASGCDGAYLSKPHIHIAAIDNSLSFPHEVWTPLLLFSSVLIFSQHPKGWRAYTYGWLFLPVSIVGRPFSEKTRNHFLPLLTSKDWWAETTYELRKLFAVDPDFHPKMFRVSMFRVDMKYHLYCLSATTCRYEGSGLQHCAIAQAR
jgi:phosphatidylinositol 4-kinase type 2